MDNYRERKFKEYMDTHKTIVIKSQKKPKEGDKKEETEK